MRARDIRPGDELPGHYFVREIVEPPEGGELVLVVVEYVDGGREYRAWDLDAETPLVRPEPGEEE